MDINAADSVSSEELPQITAAHEDYLEAILILENSSQQGEVRSVDVANLIEVSKASVNKALTALRDAGLIEQERYGRVTLTPTGRTYGERVWRRHQALRRFLVEDLGVDPEQANEEACHMEHVVTQGTIDRLEAFFEREHGRMEMPSDADPTDFGVTVKLDK